VSPRIELTFVDALARFLYLLLWFSMSRTNGGDVTCLCAFTFCYYGFLYLSCIFPRFLFLVCT
jgi:hypothetical protein